LIPRKDSDRALSRECDSALFFLAVENLEIAESLINGFGDLVTSISEKVAASREKFDLPEIVREYAGRVLIDTSKVATATSIEELMK
jgi:hypothetical protein